ncbi:MAG: hypothetical protein H6Q14_1546 [Bacteroidetes bacterium]|nr:hypothetical protein [Bacteroidota bacterium]
MKFYLLAVVAVVLIIFLIDSIKIKPVDWEQRYSLDTKNPYDLYVFNAEIKNFVNSRKIEREWLSPYERLEDQDQQSNYLIIDKNMHGLSDTILLGEVAKGSNLFISSENIFAGFVAKLKVKYANIDPDMLLDEQKTNYLVLSLTNKTWGQKKYKMEPVNNSFSFVEMDSATTTILGTQKKADGKVSPNFIRVKYGKGYIYLHNHPQVFTNMELLEQNGSTEYVANLLSYLPKDLPLVWFVNGQTSNYGAPEEKTPLSIVFQYPALRIAWLILIYGLLLFVIFHIKRRQRVIPVVQPLRNTTIEFVQTIGNLYFQEESATEIVDKKITYFLDKIRTRYYLDTSKLDERFALKLQLKSGKDALLIEKIMKQIYQFRRLKSAVPEDLVKLNDLIEKFWEK